MKNEKKQKIVWVDDEIHLLKPHILFLENKGYDVLTATNGVDALDIIRSQYIHAVLLDEMMDGVNGLAVLEKIKHLRPSLPVIMITKNEEESLMEDAIGRKISDYLTKPINPSQILLVLKKNLEGHHITQEAQAQQYMKNFGEMNIRINEDKSSLKHWATLHTDLCRWEIEFDENPQEELKNILNDQIFEANVRFEKQVIENYESWINGSADLPMSHQVLDTYVLPSLKNGEKVLLLVIDCMRLDQWLMLSPIIDQRFDSELYHQVSILPTATPYSRNALFAGDTTDKIYKRYPDIYDDPESEESMNRYERNLLEDYLENRGLSKSVSSKFQKIIHSQQGEQIAAHFSDYLGVNFLTFVVNFVDILAHRRSESDILQEIVPNESSYRKIVRSWFENSYLLKILEKAAMQDYTLIVTSDHGSRKVSRGCLVKADKETSTSVRYKVGRNLKVPDKQAYCIRDPKRFRLPETQVYTNYIFARSDYFFLYPNNLRKYEKNYPDSFQHGGISLHEMILPVAILHPRK
ncbi:MAG: bifunctional response regulator/alkaline phosphatase family protein [Candidatus Marinimicrobia bacterium]|nr:bifunctional response regulator/alkaline phosphatase family protein [Candidatus Neomarinimicrobiota bacterium]MDD5582192.1 bifunctional response regulator/alkaline phosphatase family protein [Candidatus Neomarinimicrobiota bacterium]